MISAVLAILVALVTAAVVWAAVRGQFTAVATEEDVVRGLRRVDLPAMRNLTDTSQDEFLRAHLAPADFRRLQRARKRAAIDYVAAIAHNSALLIRLGEMARRSEDPALSSSADQMISAALAVRLHAMAAIGKLVLGMAFPGASLSSAVPVDGYEALRTMVMAVGGRQRSVAVQVASNL